MAIVAIVAGCLLVASFAKHTIKWLSGEYGSGKNGGPSLTTSELEKMIQRAVHEANAPLRARVAALEEELQPREQPPAGGDQLPPAGEEKAHAAPAKASAPSHT